MASHIFLLRQRQWSLLKLSASRQAPDVQVYAPPVDLSPYLSSAGTCRRLVSLYISAACLVRCQLVDRQLSCMPIRAGFSLVRQRDFDYQAVWP